MKLRLHHLSDIDPMRVPLPHGTEVTTRVDRSVEGRVLRRGALGRVKAIEGSKVTVHIVGVGSVAYERSELAPTKAGQLEYAVRREAAWQALRPCVVVETVVGSRAWGLADELSDTDHRGVFALPFSWTAGLVEPPEDLISADGSDTYWEVGKALRQALRADPNTLEALLLPGARALDPVGEWILRERDAFVSSEIYGTFGRYALSQLKKLRQSQRLAETRHHLLAWLCEDGSLSLDEAAARLATEAGVDGATEADRVLLAKTYIKQLYRSMFDQGLLPERDYPSLVAFAGQKRHEFELPRDLRPKNAYNLLRLLATGAHWLRTGQAQFEVEGPLRDELLAIKRQEVPMARVLERAEELAEALEEARGNTPLPSKPDVERVDRLLRRIRDELARRWVQRDESAFGAQAPSLPLARWKDET